MIQYQQAIRIRPDFAPAHNNLGTLRQKQGKLDQSAVHLRQAIRINPEYSTAHNNLSVTLLAQGRLDEAEDHLRQALKTNPQMAEAHFNLGRVYGRRRQFDQAVAQYEETLRLQHDYELSSGEPVLVLEGQGQTRQARRASASSHQQFPRVARRSRRVGVDARDRGRRSATKRPGSTSLGSVLRQSDRGTSRSLLEHSGCRVRRSR